MPDSGKAVVQFESLLKVMSKGDKEIINSASRSLASEASALARIVSSFRIDADSEAGHRLAA